ncbi:MAG: restriction endonuclease subunit S, partial [Synergistales bacterium]|nr:restriction endonuclease subunit S [Synergistales bacterium]
MREVTPTRLRHVARNKIEKSTGEPAPFIGLEDVAAGAGRLATEELEPKAATDALVFAPGDVLFSKLRPYLAKSLAPEISGTCTSELLVMRPGPELDRRYLLYMSLSVPWLEWAITTSYGTKMPRTSWEAMADFAFGLPSLEEQRRIADFLDTETTRLDQVLQAREQQSALLAVREGLRCQEIIDSLAGAEHVPLRRFLRSITDGPFGSSLKSSHYSTDGARVIRLGNVGTAEFVDHDQAFIPIDYFETLRAHSVREGDIVVAGLGDASRPVGRAC